jgi:chromosome condensin MukBEF ATPase and DNA-binding subunit MukB
VLLNNSENYKVLYLDFYENHGVGVSERDVAKSLAREPYLLGGIDVDSDLSTSQSSLATRSCSSKENVVSERERERQVERASKIISPDMVRANERPDEYEKDMMAARMEMLDINLGWCLGIG